MCCNAEMVNISTMSSCAIARAVSCWLLTTEAQAHAQGNSCRICGTGTCFSLSPLVFPYIIPLLLHIASYAIWGIDNGLVSVPVPQT